PGAFAGLWFRRDLRLPDSRSRSKKIAPDGSRSRVCHPGARVRQACPVRPRPVRPVPDRLVPERLVPERLSHSRPRTGRISGTKPYPMPYTDHTVAFGKAAG